MHVWQRRIAISNSRGYGYGSIPINTIFNGMNIHLPAILMFTRGTRCWHTAISLSIIFERLIPGLSVPNVEILSGKVIKISQISTFLSHFWTKAQQQMLVTERAPKGLEPITKITLKLNHAKTRKPGSLVVSLQQISSSVLFPSILVVQSGMQPGRPKALHGNEYNKVKSLASCLLRHKPLGSAWPDQWIWIMIYLSIFL